MASLTDSLKRQRVRIWRCRRSRRRGCQRGVSATRVSAPASRAAIEPSVATQKPARKRRMSQLMVTFEGHCYDIPIRSSRSRLWDGGSPATTTYHANKRPETGRPDLWPPNCLEAGPIVWRQVSSLQVSSHPKAIGVVSDIEVVSEARRGSDGIGLVRERTAAQNAKRAISRVPGGAVLRGAAVRGVPAVLNPLGRVARSIEKAKRVGPERSCGHGLLGRIPAALDALGLPDPDVPSPPIGRYRPCARRVFPFSFSEQTVGLSALLRKPGYELLRIFPTDINYGPLAAAPPVIAGRIFANIRGDAEVPFGESHFSAADREGSSDHDVMWRGFGRIVVRTHDEVAGRYDDEFLTVRAIPKNLPRLVRLDRLWSGWRRQCRKT